MLQPAPRKVLDSIIQNVFGYGRLDAPLWFVGYEEHCDDERDAERRLSAMATLRGAHDVFEAHQWMGHPNPVNTSVWPEMQEIVRASGLRDVHVGRGDSDVFLVELLPLPHANKSAWYADLYAALGYATRDQYVAAVLKDRVARVRDLVRENQAKVVLVHHSFKDKSLLHALMGGKPTKQIKIGAKWLYIRRDGETVWLACANLSAAAFWTDSERINLRTAVRAVLARRRPFGGSESAA